MTTDEQIDFQDDWSDVWWDTLDDLEIISDSDLPQDDNILVEEQPGSYENEFDDLPELIPFDDIKSEVELNLEKLDEHIKTPNDNEFIRTILISLEQLISAKLSILDNDDC